MTRTINPATEVAKPEQRNPRRRQQRTAVLFQKTLLSNDMALVRMIIESRNTFFQ